MMKSIKLIKPITLFDISNTFLDYVKKEKKYLIIIFYKI